MKYEPLVDNLSWSYVGYLIVYLIFAYSHKSIILQPPNILFLIYFQIPFSKQVQFWLYFYLNFGQKAKIIPIQIENKDEELTRTISKLHTAKPQGELLLQSVVLGKKNGIQMMLATTH